MYVTGMGLKICIKTKKRFESTIIVMVDVLRSSNSVILRDNLNFPISTHFFLRIHIFSPFFSSVMLNSMVSYVEYTSKFYLMLSSVVLNTYLSYH